MSRYGCRGLKPVFDRYMARARSSPKCLAVAVLQALVLCAQAQEPCHYTVTELQNPAGWRCNGQAINNLGWVTGYLSNFGDNKRAFIWRPETGTTTLPMPPGITSQEATDI